MHEENTNTAAEPPINLSFPKHKCFLCDYETNTKKLLNTHKKIHSHAYEWQCTQCNYKTYRKDNLKSHAKSIHENLRYYCDLCSYNTTRTNYLKKHIKFIHKDHSSMLPTIK